MRIRKAKEGDFLAIDKLYVEGNIDESKLQFSKITLKEIKKELNKSQNRRRQGSRRYMRSKKHYWIVAEDKKEIIGFGQARIKNKDTGITESVYIDKKYRKLGVGEKIMKDMIKWLKKQKLKYIESSVYLKNTPSIKLHKKLEFKPLLLKMRLK
jgi:L-amino acid N-acyltransferase YncA